MKSFSLVLAAACASLALAACGDDDKKSSDKAATLDISASQSGKAVTIDAPSSTNGGLVKITFKNGTKGTGDAQLVRVDGDYSGAAVLKVIEQESGPIPTWLHGAGGVAEVAPGASGTAEVVLPEGTYYIATQASDDEAFKSAIKKLEVKGGDASAKLPSTTASIAASEYAFAPTGLKAGKNTITFNNVGKELHHVLAFPLAQGKTLADAKKFLATEGEPSGPPPINFEQGTGTSVLDGGTSEVTDLTFAKPGKYVLVCFINDRKGGPPHFAKGMIQEVDVK